MKLLDVDKIMSAIHTARQLYKKGKLNKEIAESTLDAFWKNIKISDANKQKLIEMAKNGESRPNSRTHPLGNVFNMYINKNSVTYDAVFDEQIRKLAPHWFVSQTNIADENKQKLIEMAKNGESRPNSRTHSLGNVFNMYIKQSNPTIYDPVFDAEIRKLAPHWFVNQTDIANENKQKLIEMAKNGEPRPNYKAHPLGNVFNLYIKSNCKCYDPKFDKQIRKLAPHWFVNRTNIANEKKQKLIEMAKNGQSRPNSRTHPLGNVFNLYIKSNCKCYDPKFDKQIRKLAPHWFRN